MQLITEMYSITDLIQKIVILFFLCSGTAIIKTKLSITLFVCVFVCVSPQQLHPHGQIGSQSARGESSCSQQYVRTAASGI